MTIYRPPGYFDDPTPSFQQILGESLGKGTEGAIKNIFKERERGRELREMEQFQRARGTQSFADQVPDSLKGEELTPEQREALEMEVLLNPPDQDYSDMERTFMRKHLPEFSKIYEDRRKGDDKEARQIRQQLTSDNAKREQSIEQRQAALNNMMHAVEKGKLGSFGRDWIADVSGMDVFRTPEGALFKASSKEFFLGSLQRAGARPNQWIEQQIQKMLPQIGINKKANLTIGEALQMEMDIEKRLIENTNKVIQADRAAGRTRTDVAERARAMTKSYAEGRQKSARKAMENIEKHGDISGKKIEKKSSEILMTAPGGQKRFVGKDQVKEALSQGYKRI